MAWILVWENLHGGWLLNFSLIHALSSSKENHEVGLAYFSTWSMMLWEREESNYIISEGQLLSGGTCGQSLYYLLNKLLQSSLVAAWQHKCWHLYLDNLENRNVSFSWSALTNLSKFNNKSSQGSQTKTHHQSTANFWESCKSTPRKVNFCWTSVRCSHQTHTQTHTHAVVCLRSRCWQYQRENQPWGEKNCLQSSETERGLYRGSDLERPTERIPMHRRFPGACRSRRICREEWRNMPKSRCAKHVASTKYGVVACCWTISNILVEMYFSQKSIYLKNEQCHTMFVTFCLLHRGHFPF